MLPGTMADVHHPDSLFVDPSYGSLALPRLAKDFDNWQRGRSSPPPPKAPSRRKYQYSLHALIQSNVNNDIPLELRYLHPHAIELWVAGCRALGNSEHGIASTLASIKVFSNSFVFKHADLTTADPLRKVPRLEAPALEMAVLTQAELDQVLASFDDRAYEGVRNRAFVALLMATGARLREARELTMDAYDPVTGEVTLLGKGERVRYARLSERPLKYLKQYLKLRPRHTSQDLWLTRDGAPLTESGWHTMLRHLKDRSGVPRLHAHLLRHTFGSIALEKGAERAAVQDMMGHESDLMTRRYTRAARKRTASLMMPGYSPI